MRGPATNSNPSKEQRYISKLDRDICTFISSLELNRLDWHSHALPPILDIVNSPAQFKGQFLGPSVDRVCR